MDGPHDLGGKTGFGKIEVSTDDPPFHHDWEGRMWGIAQSTDAPDWTIDWWRHVRELISEKDYLDRPYYDSWAQTQLAAFINSGVFSLEEAVSGKVVSPARTTADDISWDQALELDYRSAYCFEGEAHSFAVFQIGERIRTMGHGHDHHTRLPQYARGKQGTVHAHHGAHVFPDLSARGIEEHQHLYSVVFRARDLWPEAGDSQDKVYIDLWEDYLTSEPAQSRDHG
jgi:nitrile hydratase